jgi:hypothetical protein
MTIVSAITAPGLAQGCIALKTASADGYGVVLTTLNGGVKTVRSIARFIGTASEKGKEAGSSRSRVKAGLSQDVPLGDFTSTADETLGRLLAFCFSLGMAMLSSSMFNCRIDLATDQECQSRYVKPEHQNYHGT